MAIVEFSVVVPAYNRQDYLDEALQSVICQTFQDWECIIIDDASPDVKLQVPDDPRFRLFRADLNLGIPGARNAGLDRAAGKRICFLDHDDRYSADRLEVVEGHRAPVVVCQSPKYGRLEGLVHDRILDGFAPHLGKITIRRDICPRFDQRFSVSDDVDWWLRLAQQQPFATVFADAYIYRHHAETEKTGSSLRLADSLLLLETHREYFATHRRARAFRWARVAAYSDSRHDGVRAVIRSLAAMPTRQGLVQALRLLRDHR